MAKTSLYLCMGSACHQEGVYDIPPLLEALLTKYNLKDEVELKGSLCLGPCRDRIVIKVGDQLILHVNADNFEQKFVDEILPYLVGAHEE